MLNELVCHDHPYWLKAFRRDWIHNIQVAPSGLYGDMSWTICFQKKKEDQLMPPAFKVIPMLSGLHLRPSRVVQRVVQHVRESTT